MMALVVTLTTAVALLGVLVAGLLRSHADILRALHDLGAGVGDPAAATPRPSSQPIPLHLGPPLPPERAASRSFPVSGVTPWGDAIAVSVIGGDRFTLLAFLSSGCLSCRSFWDRLRNGGGVLTDAVRPVVVTKGPELEEASSVSALASPAMTVVMSTQAWSDYEVPGSPFFVLVDDGGRRLGEGVAAAFDQVADLVRRAVAESPRSTLNHMHQPVHMDGPAREADNDAVLRRAGILPGDPSLYPRTLADVYGPEPASPMPS